MTAPRVYYCKLGTMPAFIVLKGRSRPKVGRLIEFRDRDGNRGRWLLGRVTRINPDGYFFLEYV